MTVETGPKYLDQRKLYDLISCEQIIFSQISTDYSPGWKNRRIRQKDIGVTSEFLKAQKEALEVAREIETSSKFEPEGACGSMTSMQELQGCFKNIRVEVMRDVVTGHRVGGFTLIGVPK